MHSHQIRCWPCARPPLLRRTLHSHWIRCRLGAFPPSIDGMLHTPWSRCRPCANLLPWAVCCTLPSFASSHGHASFLRRHTTLPRTVVVLSLVSGCPCAWPPPLAGCWHSHWMRCWPCALPPFGADYCILVVYLTDHEHTLFHGLTALAFCMTTPHSMGGVLHTRGPRGCPALAVLDSCMSPFIGGVVALSRNLVLGGLLYRYLILG